jgi:hypothetical protein
MRDVAHISYRRARVKTAIAMALWGFTVAQGPARAVGQCCGDCNGDGTVTVEEIVTSVNRALGSCIDDGICSMESCPAQLAMCQDELADGRTQCDAIGVPTSEQDRVREVVSSFYAAFNSAFEGPADFATEDWNHQPVGAVKPPHSLISKSSSLEPGNQSLHAWHTDVYERRDGRWQVVWSQATTIGAS